MKKIYISTLFLAFAIGCQTDLDVKAQDESSRDVVLATKLGVKSYVTGLYGLAQQEGAFGGVPQLLGDWQSDNIAFKGTFPTLQEIRDYTTISTNGNVASIWQDHYEIITQANTVINKAYLTPDVDFSMDERDQAVGEAKFMRALAYFQLNCLFAQPIQTVGAGGLSVPLITKHISSVSEIGLRNTPRATVGEVYAQIEADLLDAISKIKDFNRTRANVGAAKALLARVYLYQDKFAQAADYANQTINSGKFEFASDYNFYDNKDSKEHIFNLVNLSNDSQSGSNENGPSVSFSTLTNSSANGGRGDCPFSASLNATFENSGDLRYTLKRRDIEKAGIPFYTTKYNDGLNQSSDYSVIRISEMYLIRAEANLRAGTVIGDTPVNDVNKIRRRANLPDLAVITLDDIIKERRLEFCFEGHRRMDLLRNGKQLRSSGTVPAPAETAPGKPKVVLPIPQRELDLNKNLIQNPSY
ncbi:RagB/SusD family nutrient uptake outer membrane protein [Flavobacterium davisii]|uniref:RagB/SusD family nutrient uptake outer membrane protein n=1 Tax=Flavobacterium columnare TaxID=996 RepID=A0A8G0KU49_9FLAO|nr:RagB/SusD family nutrient uptake outer membrane protein [Flavobacterium davisii]QYS88434.1 RagB/SusD family nutrient uptake outer membrane protein [Flavobacterium davisii]